MAALFTGAILACVMSLSGCGQELSARNNFGLDASTTGQGGSADAGSIAPPLDGSGVGGSAVMGGNGGSAGNGSGLAGASGTAGAGTMAGATASGGSTARRVVRLLIPRAPMQDLLIPACEAVL